MKAVKTMTTQADVEHADDVCALPLARRLAAMLDRDPATLCNGMPLPRGWHVILFNDPTRQSDLRSDGAGHLGVTLPDIGLPRLMLGGRQVAFAGDIPIGSEVRRETRNGAVTMKEGRSGRFALVTIEHRIMVGDSAAAVVIETNSYVMREAGQAADTGKAAPPAPPLADREVPAPLVTRTVVADEALLFRYSAITDNPHRIHYDLPYANAVENYPWLVVNGSIPPMFLLEMFRDLTGREPAHFASRNLAPLFCGQAITLTISEADDGFRLQARDPAGSVAFDASAH